MAGPVPDRRPWAGVFSKRPVPGAVKTRLVPELGEDGAARLQEGMLDDSVERLRGGAWQPVLAFAPSEEEAWFAGRYPDVELVAQRGAELGERLANFFSDALAHTSAVVMTGSDQPLVPQQALDDALRALASDADLVLGPDRGGGYYLVGLTRSSPELFRRVAMSTDSMFADTCGIAGELGLRLRTLEVELDVDTPSELEHLVQLLSADPHRPYTTHTRRALADLGRLPQ